MEMLFKWLLIRNRILQPNSTGSTYSPINIFIFGQTI